MNAQFLNIPFFFWPIKYTRNLWIHLHNVLHDIRLIPLQRHVKVFDFHDDREQVQEICSTASTFTNNSDDLHQLLGLYFETSVLITNKSLQWMKNNAGIIRLKWIVTSSLWQAKCSSVNIIFVSKLYNYERMCKHIDCCLQSLLKYWLNWITALLYYVS